MFTDIKVINLTIPVGATRLILATGKLIGEGFDDPQLDTLFLTMPIYWQGTLKQYAGRLHRLHEGKKVVLIYDYIDENDQYSCACLKNI